MTKRDLVVRIASETGMRQRDVQEIVQKVIDQIINELAAGRRVELRNFGVFSIRKREARTGRNPAAEGRKVKVPAKCVARFRPGKELREKVARIDC